MKPPLPIKPATKAITRRKIRRFIRRIYQAVAASSLLFFAFVLPKEHAAEFTIFVIMVLAGVTAYDLQIDANRAKRRSVLKSNIPKDKDLRDVDDSDSE